VALRLRSSAESFFARANPPILPSNTAAGFFSTASIRTRWYTVAARRQDENLREVLKNVEQIRFRLATMR